MFQCRTHDGRAIIDSGIDFLQGTNISPQGQQPSAISVNMPPDAPEDAAAAAQNLADMHELWTAWHCFGQRRLKGEQVLTYPQEAFRCSSAILVSLQKPLSPCMWSCQGMDVCSARDLFTLPPNTAMHEM